MAGFATGVAAILNDLACHACRDGMHSECEYLQMMAELNHNAFADEASSMVYLKPTCMCFRTDEDRHYDYDQDESRLEYMKPDDIPSPEEVQASWEVTYHPYPDFIRREGFEAILDRIVDFLHDPGTISLGSDWSDPMVSGHFNRKIRISIEQPLEPDDRLGVSLEGFQDHVAMVLHHLGLPGHLEAGRTVSVLPGAVEGGGE